MNQLDEMGGEAPRVTVIIPTYNRSGPLHYAVASVLAQSFDDLELLVVGDACTDDSESVVLGFNDPRVAWHNLPANSGNQFAPNNHGLAHARGNFIAYLGHDDLWHRDHLADLVSAIQSQDGDLAFSLALDIGPPDNPTRHVMGLCPDGVYEWPIWAPPSSWLHRRDVTDRIGNWRDYKSILLPTDVDFFTRIVERGLRIVPVMELTAFKLTSVARTNSYLDRTGREQAVWWDRISNDGDLRYRAMLAALAAVASRHKDVVLRLSLPSRISPGSIVDNYRARRGLGPLPRGEHALPTPLYEDRPALKLLNGEHDIVPVADRTALHEAGDMPTDGLFIGLNWHSLETAYQGPRWRWMDRNAQIVVTRPSGRTRALLIDLTPGPGFGGRPADLILRNDAGDVVATADIKAAGPVLFDIPLPTATGTIYTLDTKGGGDSIAGDPRVLNFRVFAIRWAVPTDFKES
jgi:glycosyltransferase involved in cell wall biosynthesis